MTDEPFDDVRAERPDVGPPTNVQTAAAAAALRSHMGGQQPTEHAMGRSARPLLAAAAIAALVGAAVWLRPEESVQVVAVDDETTQVGAEPDLVPEVFDQAVDLEAFISSIAALDQPTGDATIVIRAHTGGGASRYGVDLYGDDEGYAYAPSVAELSGADPSTRSWPRTAADTLRSLEGLAAVAPDAALVTFARDLPQSLSQTNTPSSSASLRRVLPVLPLTASSIEARVGAMRLLADLDGVGITGAGDANSQFVSFAVQDRGALERVVVNASGLPVRYEHTAADGTVEVVTYTIRRRELDALLD